MSTEAMKRAKEVMANARDWFGNDPEHRWDEDEVYHELVDSVVDLCKAIAEAEKQEQGEPVYEPSKTQTKQIVDGLKTCHHPISEHEFLKTWIRDWTMHKIELAKQKQGEPVAYTNGKEVILAKHWTSDYPPEGWEPLGYTTPQQRKPLTDEQMWNLWNSQGSDDMTQKEAIAFARAIEAAHGIKGEA